MNAPLCLAFVRRDKVRYVSEYTRMLVLKDSGVHSLPSKDPMTSEPSEMFSQMAFDLHHVKAPRATVELIVEYARSALQCDGAGVMVMRRNRIETMAATSPLIRTADELQQSLREGPAFAADTMSTHVLIDDTETDPRWPLWGSHVASAGLRAVLSVHLQTSERTYGALNLYSRSPGSFTASDLAVATTFARHASVALASSEEIYNLKIAVDSRKMIGQAQGILMERFGVGSDRAFDILRRYSQTSNIKLAAVAQQVVHERLLPMSHAHPIPRAAPHDELDPKVSPLTLSAHDEPPFHIISVGGELDIFTAPDFMNAAMSAVNAGRVRLVIDMGGTTFIDSSGLSSFVMLRKAVADHGGTFDVIGMADRVHKLFVMSGLNQIIRIHPDLDRAKNSYANGED